jgi:hypothetical protein
MVHLIAYSGFKVISCSGSSTFFKACAKSTYYRNYAKELLLKLISCSLFRIFLCKSIPYRTKTKRFLMNSLIFIYISIKLIFFI